MNHLFKLFLCFLFLSSAAFSQTIVTETFDNSTALPTDWVASSYAGTSTVIWSWVSGGTYPTTTPHSGSGMVQYNCYSAPSGNESILVTPSFDLSQRGANSATVSFWMYRHTQYSSYVGGKLKVYISTTTNPTNGTLMSLSDNSSIDHLVTRMDSVPTVTAAGWYCYTFTIPASYNTSTNYIIFHGASDYYNNIQVDDVTITTYPSPMAYSSSTALSVTTLAIAQGSNNNPVVAVAVTTTGAANPIALTQLVCNTNGSTNVSDISNAKIYYTGKSTSFSTANQFGTTVANPNGQFTVNGTQALFNGTNYFWITYDVTSTATIGNVVGAECTSVGVAGTNYTPTVTAPGGAREIRAPRNGTYQVGNGYYYPNLYAAFSDLNLLGMSGDVYLDIMTDIVEPASAQVGVPPVVGGSGYRLYIRPSGGPRTISGSFASTGVVVLVGTDRVTIDGGAGRNLTFRNDYAGTRQDLLIYSTGTGAGCTDVIVRNCNFLNSVATTTCYGIYINSVDNNNMLIENNYIEPYTGVITSGYYGIYFNGANTNVMIRNNTIKGCYYGIYNSSNQTNMTITGNTIHKNYYSMYMGGTKTNFVVSNNTFGTDNASEYTSYTAMYLYSTITGGLITNNHIYNVRSSSTSYCSGIYVSASSTDLTISFNKIHGLYNSYSSASGGAFGIWLTSGTNTLVANNWIWDISSPTYSASTSYGTFGIRLTGGNHRIYYNTVNLNATMYASSTTAANTNAAIMISGGASPYHDIRNNILINNTQTPNGSIKNYAVYSSSTSYLYNINYNNYYTPGTSGYFGYLAADYTSLTAWRTATAQDANSSNVSVSFLGANDLHLDGASATDQNLYCAPLAAVTTDWDGEARKTTNTNNMGSDNVTVFIGLINDINEPEPFYCADYAQFNELSFSFDAGITGFADGIQRSIVTPNFTYTWYKDNVLLEDQIENTLHITPITTNDAGNYYGVATYDNNDIVTSTKNVYVEVPIVITQDLPPNIDGCRDAGSMTLPFGATGTISYYKWYKEDVKNPGTWKQLSESGNALTIDLTDPTIETNMELHYKAEVYGPGKCGPAMLASSVTSFTLAESLRDNSVTFIDLSNPSKTSENVCTNDNVQITVHTQGTVKSYTWQKFEDNTWKPITGNATSKTATLVLNNSTTSTSGQYRCVVLGSTNCNVSELISEVTSISVYALFSIVDHPETNTLVCQGEDLMLWVVTDGEVLKYQWQRDGVDLDLEKYPTANTPILMINDFMHEMSGVFRCVITARDCRGIYAYPTDDAMVYVLRETEILTKDYSTEVRVGEVATMEVKAHVVGAPYDFPVEIQWYKGTKPPTQANMLVDDGRIAGSKSSILSINGVIASDYGEDYFCVVSGKCGTGVVSEYFAVIEPGELDFAVEPVDATTCQGEDATFTSVVTSSGNVTSIVYKWYKDGNKLDENTKYEGTDTPVLTVHSVDANDIGAYQLVVTALPSGYQISSAYLQITINSKPVITTQPESNIAVQTGKQLLLQVIVAGGSNVTYQWYKDGTALTGADEYSYLVDAVTASDAGTYYCQIGSDCGSLTTTEAIVSVTNFVGVNDETENGWGLSNVPNPFNNQTVVTFIAPKATNASIKLYDASGREIATLFNKYVEAGSYTINVDASQLNLTNGVYFYTVNADGFTKTQKMVIVK